MFKCEKCGRITNPGEKTFLKTIKTRNKKYEYVKIENNSIEVTGLSKKEIDKVREEHKRKKPIYRETNGCEIVKEIKVCGVCNDDDND